MAIPSNRPSLGNVNVMGYVPFQKKRVWVLGRRDHLARPG